MRRNYPILTASLLTLAMAAPLHAQEGPFTVHEEAQFNEPWAMAFLPDGRLLVTEKPGSLKLHDPEGETLDLSGLPEVAYGGQGGLGDVALHPDYQNNQWIYLSYAEPGEDGMAGAAVARARLNLQQDQGSLEDLEVIWRQVPKVESQGHYGHRIAFGPEGYLWISSGERMEEDPAQDTASNLGKIVRLHDDGSVPEDNAFAGEGSPSDEIWSLGHRNPLGLAFDAQDRLWTVEMGPRGGDELNRVEKGENYGWPEVSEGRHYQGEAIPEHEPGGEFRSPDLAWSPVISPSDLLIYQGEAFPDWQGDAFITGLSAQALVRVELDGDSVREAERYDMGQRLRSVAEGPDGALWVLEDERGGSGGRLLRLTPEA